MQVPVGHEDISFTSSLVGWSLVVVRVPRGWMQCFSFSLLALIDLFRLRIRLDGCTLSIDYCNGSLVAPAGGHMLHKVCVNNATCILEDYFCTAGPRGLELSNRWG